jgi:hypothetical protein
MQLQWPRANVGARAGPGSWLGVGSPLSDSTEAVATSGLVGGDLNARGVELGLRWKSISASSHASLEPDPESWGPTRAVECSTLLP